ncbi:hypothetical protein QCD60_26820 [Pokkaliibacter sp. MBI-7]|uniref:hypothetical protein n=1 Tax=Pokkaliibacter sp. MBI-7 TaxID=3040600 RepID=UPI002448E200|nr:hypothetical protein [Pokkaliibacter sp. MBI-7]MDH2436149.1 hypothetical protein [Pokkaliibacter sp. MBI-7]
MTDVVLHISVVIGASFDKVYAFLAEPANLPQWASGLSRSHLESAGPGDDNTSHWWVEAPVGRVWLRYSRSNPFGVVDHLVVLPDGNEVYVPMRVCSLSGQGCSVVLSLIRQPWMSEQDYERDASWVREDLQRLRQLMEHSG